MGDSKSSQWSFLILCLMAIVVTIEAAAPAASSGNIPLILLQSAVAKGAVCLDGSPPGYHFQPGSGLGADNWIVLMEGGGWCDTVEVCLQRRDTYRGSSLKMDKFEGFSGFLGSVPTTNPDFYDWNRVKIKYCDGASFTGDVEAVDPKTNLHFRGARIWDAMMDELMAKGLNKAKNAILSGCSAGGLAAILHCDKFKSLLPKTAKVKCAPDAGFFIHGKDVSNGYAIEDFFRRVATLHGSAKNLPAACTAKNKPELCFFPEYVAQTMTTPLFIINSAYDYWQLEHIFAPNEVDKTMAWNDCKNNLSKCTPVQMKAIQDWRMQFITALNMGVAHKPENGYFIDSCYAHCQASNAPNWLGPTAITLNNVPLGKAVGDWFFDRASFKNIDPPYPSNPTCPPTNASTSV